LNFLVASSSEYGNGGTVNLYLYDTSLTGNIYACNSDIQNI